MTAEQRAEAFEAFKAKVNETDAARRDGGWALAMERGAVIAEMGHPLPELVRFLIHVRDQYDLNPDDDSEAADLIEQTRAAIKRGATT
jgi:hypothetical protein